MNHITVPVKNLLACHSNLSLLLLFDALLFGFVRLLDAGVVLIPKPSRILIAMFANTRPSSCRQQTRHTGTPFRVWKGTR